MSYAALGPGGGRGPPSLLFSNGIHLPLRRLGCQYIETSLVTIGAPISTSKTKKDVVGAMTKGSAQFAELDSSLQKEVFYTSFLPVSHWDTQKVLEPGANRSRRRTCNLISKLDEGSRKDPLRHDLKMWRVDSFLVPSSEGKV